MRKRNVLLQDVSNLNVVGLCKENVCRFKMRFDEDMMEVVLIEKVDKDRYQLTKIPPLVPATTVATYGWAEEAMYHLLPEFAGITPDMRTKILNYFGEKAS